MASARTRIPLVDFLRVYPSEDRFPAGTTHVDLSVDFATDTVIARATSGTNPVHVPGVTPPTQFIMTFRDVDRSYRQLVGRATSIAPSAQSFWRIDNPWLWGAAGLVAVSGYGVYRLVRRR